jgi:hypothetical protein
MTRAADWSVFVLTPVLQYSSAGLGLVLFQGAAVPGAPASSSVLLLGLLVCKQWPCRVRLCHLLPFSAPASSWRGSGSRRKCVWCSH